MEPLANLISRRAPMHLNHEHAGSLVGQIDSIGQLVGWAAEIVCAKHNSLDLYQHFAGSARATVSIHQFATGRRRAARAETREMLQTSVPRRVLRSMALLLDRLVWCERRAGHAGI